MNVNEMNLDQLRKRVIELENQRGLFEKEGIIAYINDPEAPTANFKKISIGIDATQILNNKEFKDFFPCQITGFKKDLWAMLDQTSGTAKFHPGDRVRVLCDATNFQISEETFPKGSTSKRPAIFANNDLFRIEMLEPAAKVPGFDAKTSASNETYELDGMTFTKGVKPNPMPEAQAGSPGYDYNEQIGMVEKLPF